jgi:hypothetical protein
MPTRVALAVLMVLPFLLGACGEEPAPKGALTMTVAPSSVDADGVTSALISVDGTSIGNVTIRSNRGTFEGVGSIVFFNKAPFSTQLVTCDSRGDSSCAGMALIIASDESLASARAQVSFRQIP